MIKLRLPARSLIPQAEIKIVIIGGGFTGATLALLLTRRSHDKHIAITVFEPRSSAWNRRGL